MALPPRQGPGGSTGRPKASGIVSKQSGVMDVFKSALFGPQDPVTPSESTQEEGARAWQYIAGYNLPYQPRASENLTPFSYLINLAEMYDDLATAISYWVEQIAHLEWQVISDDPDPNVEIDAKLADDIRFRLRHLDGDESRDTLPWVLSELSREADVTDAVTIYPQKTRGGDTLGAFLIDGSTIRPLTDAHGRTPPLGAPAYQQVIYGQPTWEGERNQLLYLPRYPRINSMYGRSPTEDILMAINRALRRQGFDLRYYSDSNIPEAIVPLAAEFTPEQIRTFQEWFDMIVAAPERRRSLHFIPAGPNFRPFQFKEPILDTAVEEFLAKKVWARLGVTANELGYTTDVNRAVGQTQENVVQRRGLPRLRYISWCMTQVITALGFKGARFRFAAEVPSEDELQSARVDDIYIRNGVYSADAVLERKGLEKIGAGRHNVYLGSGPVQLPIGEDLSEEEVQAQEQEKAAVAFEQQKALVAAKSGGPDDGSNQDGGKPAAAKDDKGGDSADVARVIAAERLRSLGALLRNSGDDRP